MQEDVFGLSGSVIDGRYRVDEAIGEGGFGVVYRGWHLSLDHAVALKFLKIPTHFTAEARQHFLETFRREGKVLSALSSRHLSIVRVYDCGVAQVGGMSLPYLVLEWLEGRDLDAALAARMASSAGPYPEQEALSLLRPAIEALATAHESSPPIAHRDVKPANLFLVQQPRGSSLKLLDFGIAKVMQEGETATQLKTNTTSGFSAFSPQYGAPEQFHSGKGGYGPTGPWTDVHAVGLILVELVTGKPALDGDNQYTFFTSSTSSVRPTPRARGAAQRVSDGFESLCARALAVKPSERFGDASELLAAVDALASAGSRASVERRRLSGRMRAALAMVAVTLCLVGLVIASGALGHTRPPPAQPGRRAAAAQTHPTPEVHGHTTETKANAPATSNTQRDEPPEPARAAESNGDTAVPIPGSLIAMSEPGTPPPAPTALRDPQERSAEDPPAPKGLTTSKVPRARMVRLPSPEQLQRALAAEIEGLSATSIEPGLYVLDTSVECCGSNLIEAKGLLLVLPPTSAGYRMPEAVYYDDVGVRGWSHTYSPPGRRATSADPSLPSSARVWTSQYANRGLLVGDTRLVDYRKSGGSASSSGYRVWRRAPELRLTSSPLTRELERMKRE